MNTLSQLWSSASIKPFMARYTDGTVLLVTQQVNNDWYLGSALTILIDGNYMYSVGQLIVPGSISGWTAL